MMTVNDDASLARRFRVLQRVVRSKLPPDEMLVVLIALIR